jgi:hypothetical protein
MLETSGDRPLQCASCRHTFTPTQEEDKTATPGGPRPDWGGLASAAREVEVSEPLFRMVPDEVPTQTKPSALDELAGNRLPRCPQCNGAVSWSASHCPTCGEELEAESAEEILKRTKPLRRDCRAHRGKELVVWANIGLILGMAAPCTLGWSVAAALPTCVVVAIWANLDMASMKRGELDPEGMELARQARNSAVTGIILSLCLAGLALAFWLSF